jgi:F-type H+-transporting ATPase subunit b
MVVNLNEIFNELVSNLEDGLNSVLQRPDIVVLNLLAFFVLVLIVKRFFWSKVTLFLEKRQEMIHEAITSAEAERKHAIPIQAQASKDYEAMKEETRVLKEKLTQEAYEQQEQMIDAAKAEAKRRLEQVEKDIQFEIEQANESIKESIKTIAFAAAEKIVKREIDESLHQDLIDEIIRENTR